MSNPNLKYRIKLSEEQRQELMEISKNGAKAAKQVNHANVLLMADDNAVAGRWRDEDISQALSMHINTVAFSSFDKSPQVFDRYSKSLLAINSWFADSITFCR